MSRNPDKKETLVPETNLYRKDRPSRWTVRRDQWFKNSMVGNPLVYTDSWRVTHEEKRRFFDTHAEALAYADRRARTREYVLPRVNNPAGEFEIIQSSSTVEIYSPAGDATAYTTYEQAKPLALALLAHAERKKHDQHRKSR